MLHHLALRFLQLYLFQSKGGQMWLRSSAVYLLWYFKAVELQSHFSLNRQNLNLYMEKISFQGLK